VGVAGPACQLRGRITDWFSMPPFLLLWSKKALGRFLRAQMSYDESTNRLQLKGRSWKTAPWLHLQQHVDDVHEQTPWMYCTDCHDYMIPSVKVPSETVELQPKSSLRIPMRNRQEALYTRWHLDLGFPHLRESLLKNFPALQAQLPTDAEVLEFHRFKQLWVNQLRGLDPRSSRAKEHAGANAYAQKLEELEYKWAPPPHRRSDMDNSPIPESFFKQAAGDIGSWDLRRVYKRDLVPVEQVDLMQDMPDLPELQDIRSCEARACISLCRPEGRYVNRRKLKGKRAPIVATQPFHAGEFSLRSLTADEDTARGFITGLVASPDHLTKMFQMKDNEGKQLHKVLPALRERNPWHGAYCTSLKHVHEMNGFLQELKDTGCIAPKVPQGITTAAGNALSEELGAERAVLLIPAEAFEVSGSYEKLRICADAICRSELLRTLPKEWQECFFPFVPNKTEQNKWIRLRETNAPLLIFAFLSLDLTVA